MDIYQLFRLLLMLRLSYGAARLCGANLLFGGASRAVASHRPVSSRR